MIKEQVEFVFGCFILRDVFDQDIWYYYYEMKCGMEKCGEDFEKNMVIIFVDGKVSMVIGDFELFEDFNMLLD